MVKAQGLPGDGHGSVWSKETTGQGLRGVATPGWKKRQPGGPVGDVVEFCLVGGGEYVRERLGWAWKGAVPGEEQGTAFQQQGRACPEAQKRGLAQGAREAVECTS